MRIRTRRPASHVVLALALLLVGACNSSSDDSDASRSGTQTWDAVRAAIGIAPNDELEASGPAIDIPADVYANFYGMTEGASAATDAGLARASRGAFNRIATATDFAATSVTQMVGEFRDAEQATAALELLPRRAFEELGRVGQVADLVDLPRVELGDQYGWGKAMSMTTGQGVRLRRAEYGWRVDRFVVNVLVFSQEAGEPASVATELAQALNGRLRTPAG